MFQALKYRDNPTLRDSHLKELTVDCVKNAMYLQNRSNHSARASAVKVGQDSWYKLFLFAIFAQSWLYSRAGCEDHWAQRHVSLCNYDPGMSAMQKLYIEVLIALQGPISHHARGASRASK